MQVLVVYEAQCLRASGKKYTHIANSDRYPSKRRHVGDCGGLKWNFRSPDPAHDPSSLDTFRRMQQLPVLCHTPCHPPSGNSPTPELKAHPDPDSVGLRSNYSPTLGLAPLDSPLISSIFTRKLLTWIETRILILTPCAFRSYQFASSPASSPTATSAIARLAISPRSTSPPTPKPISINSSPIPTTTITRTPPPGLTARNVVGHGQANITISVSNPFPSPTYPIPRYLTWDA